MQEYMTPDSIHQTLQAKFGDAVTAFDAEAHDPTITVQAGVITDVAQYLRDDDALKFDALMCLSSVDWGEEVGVVYHLHSMSLDHTITLKVSVSRENAVVPSVANIWRTADWHEREAYDMMGIVFTNHPDLRRILCPDDWEGWPLRKDYVVQEYYQGMYVPYPGTPPESKEDGADGSEA
jgi:NADH-quinone oxidoreductase subunit C